MVYGLIVILFVILVPAVFLAWRLRQGEAPSPGGSLGRQLFGRKDDDWGPKSDSPQ
jgi:hypothetical protein